jgi:YidC/Oxa1 family membrane protein insertase
MGNLFNTVLIHPIINILVAIYVGLSAVHIPYALGFSIILLTVVIRLILYPLTHQSLKHQKKIQDIQPHINKIKEKYKNDTKRQQVEMMAMYKEQGVNPAGGCVFVLIQFPILIALYQVLLTVVHLKSPNEINNLLYFSQLKLTHLWDTTFFGLPLQLTPAQLLPKVGILIILVAVITGALQLLQSKMMMPFKSEEAKQKEKNEKAQEDMMAGMQSQMMLLMPVMIGVFSYTLPIGLSLYWNTLTIFGIIQQYHVSKWGGLTEWLPFLGKGK